MFVQTDSLTGRTYLYIAAGWESGFNMYDVTNPATPVLLAEWDLTPACEEDWYSHTIDVAVRDGRRYVTIVAEVFNLGDRPARPSSATAIDRGRSGSWTPTVPSRLGPAWDQGPDDEDRLRRSSEAALGATWTNPANRAGGHLRFSPHNQQIVGDSIYLSHDHGGVYVLDASDAFRGKRARPRQLGFMVPQGDMNEVRPTNYRGGLGRPAILDVVHHKSYALAAACSEAALAQTWPQRFAGIDELDDIERVDAGALDLTEQIATRLGADESERQRLDVGWVEPGERKVERAIIDDPSGEGAQRLAARRGSGGEQQEKRQGRERGASVR